MAVTMSPVVQTHILSGQDATSIHFNEPQAADPPAYQPWQDEKAATSEICCTEHLPRQTELKTVVIPDLFVSFVAQRPKPNPYYEVIKKESEAWMKQYETTHSLPRLQWETQVAADASVRICHWTEKEHMKHVRADFPYFAAVWTTEAGPDEFRTICDWCNWVGLYNNGLR